VGILDIEDMKRLNYLPVFFVAAVSMGTVLEATKGLEVLTNYMFAWTQPFMTNIFTTTIVMYWTAFVYHFLLAREISMLGTSPLVMEFAKSHDMHPLLLGMIWTFAAGGKLFAYQSGVLIVGYSYRYFAARDLVHMGSSETARVIRQKRSPVKSALFAPKVSGTIPARNETYP
jgi:solute carrier family 13 (sodium-dependent dicarboxylate transporter), member 2/3/5